MRRLFRVYRPQTESTMSLLRTLRRLFQPTILVDPLFGRLRYQKRAGFWEGRTFFEPANREMEILVDGDENGPTEAQRDFYRTLERRYAALLPDLETVLIEAAGDWEGGLAHDEVWQTFTLIGIDIPLPGDSPHWELSYAHARDDHSFDVQMEGWTPVGVAVNG